MRSKQLCSGLAAALGCALAGCGGSGTTPVSTGPTSTTVDYAFQGQAPTSIAVAIGAHAFASATLQSGKLSISVPNGTANYAIAYVCPMAAGLGDLVTAEYVIQASTADGNNFSAGCNEVGGNTASATGHVDASAIGGVTDVLIRGSQGYGGSLGSDRGSFNVNLLSGANDVAFVAVDASGNVRAVKIFRAQAVPGSVNSDNTVTFQASDQTTTQALNVQNIPTGFAAPPSASVQYFTAGGTPFALGSNSSSQYPVIPAAYVESGDFYSFQANTSDLATHSKSIGMTQNATGGGAATLSLPKPWGYAGPTPAELPTFNFNYSGYSGMSSVAQQAELEWIPSTNSLYTITVTATASYQSGSNSVTIPDLSSVGGFLPSAQSGSEVYWLASVWGGTSPVFDFLSAPPANGSISFVQKSGTFTQP